MSRKIGLVIVLIISAVLLYSLGQQTYNALLVAKRLDQEADQVTQLQQENERLKKQVAAANSRGFIEEQARNKLGFSREGETVVIIPSGELAKALVVKKSEEIKIPNWQGWLKLFFN